MIPVSLFPPRALLVVVPLFIASLSSACDILGPGGSQNRVQYGVEALEVFEVTHDWATHPVAYLRARLFAVNLTDDSVTISMPSCMLPLEAVRASAAGTEAEPVWRSANRLDWPGGVGYACLAIASVAQLAPRDTLRTWAGLTTVIPLAEILADSLPTGPYSFRVRIQSEATTGSSVRDEDSLVELGEVVLPESRYPLSLGVYPRDGFFFAVTVSAPNAPGTYATAILEVSHSDRYAGRLTRDLSLNCPVRLLAFRSADERETIPVPSPVWAWPYVFSCDTVPAPVRLGPGEKVTFQMGVPSHVVGVGGDPIGSFFLMAIVDVDGRPIRFAVNP